MDKKRNRREKPTGRPMDEREVFVLLRRLAAKLALDNGGILVIREAELSEVPVGNLKIMVQSGDLVVEFHEVSKEQN